MQFWLGMGTDEVTGVPLKLPSELSGETLIQGWPWILVLSDIITDYYYAVLMQRKMHMQLLAVITMYSLAAALPESRGIFSKTSWIFQTLFSHYRIMCSRQVNGLYKSIIVESLCPHSLSLQFEFENPNNLTVEFGVVGPSSRLHLCYTELGTA